MNKILITILTSCDLKLLDLSIWSSINQDYENYDIYIIVNSKNSIYYNEVKHFCSEKYPGKIKKIIETESNGKPGKGHNSCIQEFNKTEYEYLVILDGDDFLYPCALRRLNNLYEKGHDIVLLDGNPSKITYKNKFTESTNNNIKQFNYNNNIYIEQNIVNKISDDFNNIIATPFRLISINKSFSNNNEKIYDEHMGIYDDYVTFLKIYDYFINNKYNIGFYSDPYIYIYNGNNALSVTKINNESENDKIKYHLKPTYDKYIKQLKVEKLVVIPNININKNEIYLFENELTSKYNINITDYKIKKIDNILFYDTGIIWNYDTINKSSLRGTENAIYQLSKFLSELNLNKICVLTNGGVFNKNKNIIFDNNLNINHYKNDYNIIIHQGKLTNINIYNNNHKHIIYIHHDINVEFIKKEYNNVEQFDKYIFKYLFVSHWQKNRYIQYFNLNPDKCYVIQNAINPILEKNIINVKTNTLIYFATPYRGLLNVLPMFNKIREYIPNINIKIFSSFLLENNNDNNPLKLDDLKNINNGYDKYYINIYKLLINNENVNFYGNVPQEILFKHLKESKILMYPNTYPETCCTSILEAMACRNFIVSSDIGALRETSNGMAYLYDPCIDVNHNNINHNEVVSNPPNINDLSINYKKSFMEKIIEILNNYNSINYQKHLDRQQKYINEKCLWKNKAIDFLNILDD